MKSRKYKGITDTTRELLNFWFHTDHVLSNGLNFCFHTAQCEAMETLIFIFEVAKIKNRMELLQQYAFSLKDKQFPPHDDFARYCLKLATGSGKTFVMSMAIVWRFANYLRGEKGYANNFLILAPNIIVFYRLKSDYESGTVFNYTPCDNEYEYDFAKFLDKSDNVIAFSKLPEQFGFVFNTPIHLQTSEIIFPTSLHCMKMEAVG